MNTKIFKKIFPLALVLVFLFTPVFSQAAVTGLAFGGLNEVTIPCTCSPSVFWHWFTPFYNNTSVPTVGALSSAPSSITFLYYFIHPGNWSLGTYTPGVQMCWMHAAFFCFPLPTLGHIVPPTGTSP